MSDYDLRYLAAGVKALEGYLLSSGLYWSPGTQAWPGEAPYPSLTPGNLLLASLRARTRLSGLNVPELDYLQHEFKAILTKWRVTWEKKVAQDFHARLRLWGEFLDEYRQAPPANYDRYPYEVSRRVQLHLLQMEAKDLPEQEITLLEKLDRRLKAGLNPGSFIWESSLESGFPVEPYWYLYGKVREDD